MPTSCVVVSSNNHHEIGGGISSIIFQQIWKGGENGSVLHHDKMRIGPLGS